jgi:hypothetical protein
MLWKFSTLFKEISTRAKERSQKFSVGIGKTRGIKKEE